MSLNSHKPDSKGSSFIGAARAVLLATSMTVAGNIGCGWSGGNTTTTTTPPIDNTDITPAQFTLNPIVWALPDTYQNSNEFQVTGITAPAPISLTNWAEYSISGGAWTSTPGTVANLQYVKVRIKSSASYGATVSTTLSIGSASAPVTSVFSITTMNEPATVPFISPITLNAWATSFDTENPSITITGGEDLPTDTKTVDARLVESYFKADEALQPAYPTLTNPAWHTYNPASTTVGHTVDTLKWWGRRTGTVVVRMFAKSGTTICPPVSSEINATFTGPYLGITTTDNRPAGTPPNGYPTPKPEIMLTAVTGTATINIAFGNFTEMVWLPTVTISDSTFVSVTNRTQNQITLAAGTSTTQERMITINVSATVINPTDWLPKTISYAFNAYYDVPTWGFGW